MSLMRQSILLLLLALFACTLGQLVVPQGYQIRQIFRPRNCRRPANTGDKISFHYIASIARGSPTGTGGEQFDSTADFKPIELVLTERNLIQGLYHGLLGACDMEKRVITIPAEWAFGEKGHLDVPGNATVVFSIHMIGVEPHIDMFGVMDTDKNGCVDEEEVKVWLRNQRVSAAYVDAVSRRIMYYDDKNKDGWITCDEMSGDNKDCLLHVATCKQDSLWLNLADMAMADVPPEDNSISFEDAMASLPADLTAPAPHTGGL